MKRIIIMLAMIATPAAAAQPAAQESPTGWVYDQLQWEASRSPQHKAVTACFQGAPDRGPRVLDIYYKKCLAAACILPAGNDPIAGCAPAKPK